MTITPVAADSTVDADGSGPAGEPGRPGERHAGEPSEPGEYAPKRQDHALVTCENTTEAQVYLHGRIPSKAALPDGQPSPLSCLYLRRWIDSGTFVGPGGSSGIVRATIPWPR